MIFLLLLSLICVLTWHYLKHHYSFWERQGVPQDSHSQIPLGCLKSVCKHEKSMGMAIYDAYKRSQAPFMGIYLLFRRAILIRDAGLVRSVLTTDFASFHDRGIYVDAENDPLSGNIFALRGQSWRSMRLKLAPCFTSGKLKVMFGAATDIGDKMVAHLHKLLPSAGYKEVDLKQICTFYAIDLIATTIFGLDVNSFEQPQNKFIAILKTARRNTAFNNIFGMLIFLCPAVAKFMFKIGFKNPVGLALHEIIKDTIEYREQNNIVRKDMLQLLMQLRNNGSIDDTEDNWNASDNATETKNKNQMPLELITAQAFIFYIAGQETTASTAAFTIFELAQYPELLQRLQSEITETLTQNGGVISYEVLQNMPFLELCLKETLRKYPGLPMLNRECTKDFTIPDTNIVIQKGTAIVISLFGLHRDPVYFPDPDRYDPERFLETKSNYDPTAYMPFGEGPRICIAQRMGRVNAKLAIVKILQNFDIEIMEKREIVVDNFSVAIVPKDGVKVRLARKI